MENLMRQLVDLLAAEVIKKIKEDELLKEEKTVERTKIKGVKGIAEFLEIAPSTVQRMNAAGKLPVYWSGKKIYSYSDELEAEIKKGGTK